MPLIRVGALLRSDSAVECRSAHSGKKLHSKCDAIIVSGRPSSCFFWLLSLAWALRYLLNPKQQKTRYIAVTGFFN
ncbi:hypothetical protein AMS57_09820 [Pseudoalteromonas undina]|nr:hypothetical protein AMS57_09820 [Pseudoalteromonas undina]